MAEELEATTPEDTGPLDYRTTPDDPPENGFQLKTPEFVVEPYQDVTMCYYGTYTGESAGIHFYEWFQDTHAGHHFMVLVPEEGDTTPDDTFLDCSLPDASEMKGVSPLLQGTTAVSKLNGQMILPEGKAVKLDQGQRWVLQSHYLNTTGDALLVQDSANFGLISPDEVDG